MSKIQNVGTVLIYREEEKKLCAALLSGISTLITDKLFERNKFFEKKISIRVNMGFVSRRFAVDKRTFCFVSLLFLVRTITATTQFNVWKMTGVTSPTSLLS